MISAPCCTRKQTPRLAGRVDVVYNILYAVGTVHGGKYFEHMSMS